MNLKKEINDNLIKMINFKIKNKMMNRKQIGFFAYVLLVAIIFCGCCRNGNQILSHDVLDRHVKIFVIDDCEYIYVLDGSGSWGSHKGNCKFCLERSKK